MEGKKNISSLLQKLEQFWDTPEKTYTDVPDGTYQVKIETAVLNESKSSGRLQCSFSFRILEGDFANRKLFKHAGLDNEDSVAYFRGDLGKLGYEWPDEPKNLPSVLEQILDTFCEVRVKSKAGSDFTNIYFVRAIDPIASQDESENEETEETEEDAPNEVAASDLRFAFDEDDITDPQKEKIIAMAEEKQMNLDMYNEYIHILKDMCEVAEIEGEFASPKVVIRALEGR